MRTSAPLQPPLAFNEGGQDGNWLEQETRLKSIHVEPTLGSRNTEDEQCRQCRQCSVTVLRQWLEAVRTLLQPCEVCQTSSIAGPELEVREDGIMTYEWKSVVERDRSFHAANSPKGVTKPADNLR